MKDDPDAVLLGENAKELSVAIMQLIYERKPYEGSAKDYEFSCATMLEHWAERFCAAIEAAKVELAERLEAGTVGLGAAARWQQDSVRGRARRGRRRRLRPGLVVARALP